MKRKFISMVQKAYPTTLITLIAYVLSGVICILFGFILENSFIAVFAPSCILMIRGILACILQEKRHVVFAIIEGTALFSVIRFLPILFS